MPVFQGTRYVLGNCIKVTTSNNPAGLITVLDMERISAEDLINGWNTRQVREDIDLDLIAYNITNKSGMWFLIADISNIVDPFEPLEVGDTLTIPTKQSFDDVLTRLTRNA